LLDIGPGDVFAGEPCRRFIHRQLYAVHHCYDATGQVSGVAADKVVELMRCTAESFTLKVQPWPRSFQQIQIVQNSCAYPMVRTPQREERFKWVGPLAVNNYAVFARAGDHAHAADLAALRRYTIGTKRQDAASEYLTSKGYRIEAIATDIDNARKLKLRRFDYWATAQLVGLEILRQQELDKEIVPLFVFMHADLYLACHRSVGDEKIARWQQTLQSMDSDGSSLLIEKRYASYHRDQSQSGERWPPPPSK
jgi:polar amino acid transport system substrate-binding protein